MYSPHREFLYLFSGSDVEPVSVCVYVWSGPAFISPVSSVSPSTCVSDCLIFCRSVCLSDPSKRTSCSHVSASAFVSATVKGFVERNQ